MSRNEKQALISGFLAVNVLIQLHRQEWDKAFWREKTEVSNHDFWCGWPL
jgi:hypothetical protein